MRPPSGRRVAAAAAVLVLLAVVLPGWRVGLLQVVVAAAVLLLAVVQLRRLPVLSPVGWALVAVLTGYGAGQVLALHEGAHTALSRGLVLAGQGLGLALLVPALRRRRRGVGRERARVWWIEIAVVATGTAVGVVQITTSARRSPVVQADLATALALAADVAVLSCLVWLLLQRRSRAPGASLLTGAGVALAATDIVAAFSGDVPGSTGSPLPVLHLVVVLLFVAGALHPSTRVLETGGPVSEPRPAVARLVAVLPWGLMPLVSHLTGLLDPAARLPATWLLLASVVLFVLALLRAAGLLLAADRRSERDPLTGQLGRLGVERVLAAAHQEGRGAHVVMLDLDGFKRVNDTRGHQVGDDLLCEVTARLVRDLPPGSAVGRLGGDEVVALVPVGGGVVVPEDTARRVHAAFALPFGVDGAALTITASIGVADLTAAAGPTEALAAADVAMYASKRGGRDRWSVDREGLRQEVLGPVELLEDLRRLLTDGPGAGALVVLYQPVVELLTGRAHGVEALVRWDHPVRGRLEPQEFLPLAEHAGLGAELDRRVAVAAALQVAAWDRTGLDGLVAVCLNLGAGSLSSPTLAHDLAAAFREAGTDLARLALEVTERERVVPEALVLEQLHLLLAGGAALALDDFGTGHAALEHLLEWPVDRVKLDRGLLPSARRGGGAVGIAPERLLPAVAALVRSVGLSVLVEGIETEEDRVLAVAAGALRGQGYLFARPMEPGALALWWHRNHGSDAAPGPVPAVAAPVSKTAAAGGRSG